MKELVTRSLAGLVYVGLMLTALKFSFAAVSILMSLFLYICCAELGGIIGMNEKELNVFQLLSVLAYYLLIAPVFIPLNHLVYIPMAIVSGSMFALAAFKQFNMVFGIIYLTIPLAMLSYIGMPDLHFIEGKWIYNEQFDTTPMLVIFIFIWTYDTFAYVFGRLIGKKPLAPKISPKKTWEGLFGGIIITVFIAMLLSQYVNLDVYLLVPLSICIALSGTIGDLFESYLKRKANVKDSGTILPGHGGLLDRLDGVLLAIPSAVCYIYLYTNL